jgi:hypothetical protein
LVKLALVCQYYRIFKFQSEQHQSIYLGIFIIICYLELVLSTALICSPTRKWWDFEIPGKCPNFDVIWPFNASLNIVTDFLLIALPLPAIRKLNLPLKTRRALIIAFCIGGSGCVISIMRLYSMM